MPRNIDDNEEYCPNCGQYTGGEPECPNCGAILRKRGENDSDDDFEGFHEDDGSFDDDDEMN